MSCAVLPPSVVGSLPLPVQTGLCNSRSVEIRAVTPLAVIAHFNPPGHILVDGARLTERSSDDELLEFYRVVAPWILTVIGAGDEMDVDDFAARFASTALRRVRGDLHFLPVATVSDSTELFVRSLWETTGAVDMAVLWEQAQIRARRHDPHRIARMGGTLLTRSPVVDLAQTMRRAAVRFSNRFWWDVDATIQNWVDPSTSTQRMAARVQGKWVPLAVAGRSPRGDLWNLFPVAAAEGRVGGSLDRSDLLVLAGWKDEVVSPPPVSWPERGARQIEASLYLQGGYSLNRLIHQGGPLPGVEFAAAIGQDFGAAGHWQILGTVDAGGFGPLVVGAVVEASF